MTVQRFSKSFTQQEALPDAAIARAVEIMRSGKLHRYNTGPGEQSEVALLEAEYAHYQGANYCLACTSGGTAMQIGLRTAGVSAGDTVLANAWTLAPVPGAMHAVGAKVVLVETGDDLRIDIDDLIAQADATQARFLLLSHMRGHIGDMERIAQICAARNITLIEDCAHTMGARWNGVRSGNFGKLACFSTQTYKHLNSGEGGFLTTNDPQIAAKAVILSGSYMLYGRHGAIPAAQCFDAVKLEMPNCSSRMDNLRAAILRPQLTGLDANIARWNQRYQIIENGLQGSADIATIKRPAAETMVGSSIQFRLKRPHSKIKAYIKRKLDVGIDLKWFGEAEPKAFTSRYDSWRYLGATRDLPKTKAALDQLLDMRIPLTFSEEDCQTLAVLLRP